jgi:integrase
MNRKKKEAGLQPIGDDQWKIVCRIRMNGKIIQRRQTIKGTKEQARELLARFKREIREGRAASSLTEIKTFGEALSFYLERNDPGRSKPYFTRLLADLGNVSLLVLGDRFDKYLQLLKSTIGFRTGKPIAAGTINQYLFRSKAALNFCVKHGLLTENPLNRFTKLKETPRDVILSEIDKQRLLNVIEKEAPHLSAITRFALQVPSRRSELVQMTVDDLDLFNNAIRVRNGETKNGAGLWKPIPPDMREYFRIIPPGCKFLFYRQDKNGFHGLGDFKKAWRRCLRIARISDFRFHDTRHCSASALVDNGTPEQVVMSIAGWKTNMLRVYYNRDPKRTLDLVRFDRKSFTDASHALHICGDSRGNSEYLQKVG